MITKKGTVIKKSGQKTIKVEVREYRQHPKYKKLFPVSRKFLAHDEKEQANEGDTVTIQQCVPHSKLKTWDLVSVDETSK